MTSFEKRTERGSPNPTQLAYKAKAKKWPEMSEEERKEEMAKYTWRNGAKVRKP